jgi:signal transduction histidine kinase
LHSRLAHYLALLALLVLMLYGALALVYTQVAHDLVQDAPQVPETLYQAFGKAFLALCMFVALLAWWIVLTRESRSVAQKESERQTLLLMQEIEAHQRTDEALQKAKEAAETANAAKSRYVTGLSHELRTPLNSILGYAQILQRDAGLAQNQRDGLATIQRSGAHLLSLIDGLLDVARIEAGKLNLEPSEIAFPEFIRQLQLMVGPQAEEKAPGACPRWYAATRSACARSSSTCSATRCATPSRAA